MSRNTRLSSTHVGALWSEIANSIGCKHQIKLYACGDPVVRRGLKLFLRFHVLFSPFVLLFIYPCIYWFQSPDAADRYEQVSAIPRNHLPARPVQLPATDQQVAFSQGNVPRLKLAFLSLFWTQLFQFLSADWFVAIVDDSLQYRFHKLMSVFYESYLLFMIALSELGMMCYSVSDTVYTRKIEIRVLLSGVESKTFRLLVWMLYH